MKIFCVHPNNYITSFFWKGDTEPTLELSDPNWVHVGTCLDQIFSGASTGLYPLEEYPYVIEAIGSRGDYPCWVIDVPIECLLTHSNCTIRQWAVERAKRLKEVV